MTSNAGLIRSAGELAGLMTAKAQLVSFGQYVHAFAFGILGGSDQSHFNVAECVVQYFLSE